MGISNGQLNALNVLGIRKLNYIPNHFTRITLTEGCDIAKVDHWVYETLNGRYSLCKKRVLSNGHTIDQYLLAFEESSDATIAILACPHINK